MKYIITFSSEPICRTSHFTLTYTQPRPISTTTRDGNRLRTPQPSPVVRAITTSKQVTSWQRRRQTRLWFSTRRTLACILCFDVLSKWVADADSICNRCDINTNLPRQICGMVLPDGPSMCRQIPRYARNILELVTARGLDIGYARHMLSVCSPYSYHA